MRLLPRGGERLADLSALAELPAVRHLLIDFGALYSDVGSGMGLDGIARVPELERLQVHLDKPVSLAPLAGHPRLRGVLVAGPIATSRRSASSRAWRTSRCARRRCATWRRSLGRRDCVRSTSSWAGSPTSRACAR